MVYDTPCKLLSVVQRMLPLLMKHKWGETNQSYRAGTGPWSASHHVDDDQHMWSKISRKMCSEMKVPKTFRWIVRSWSLCPSQASLQKQADGKEDANKISLLKVLDVGKSGLPRSSNEYANLSKGIQIDLLASRRVHILMDCILTVASFPFHPRRTTTKNSCAGSTLRL
eukprot:1659740-Amphidinium_carterae.1